MTVIVVEDKVWGQVAHTALSHNVLMSRLKVNKGFMCSQHLHRRRFNSFYVVSGKLLLEVWREGLGKEPEVHTLGPDTVAVVDPGHIHRFRVLESGMLIEIYWTGDGTPVSLNDIERFSVGSVDPLLSEVAL